MRRRLTRLHKDDVEKERAAAGKLSGWFVTDGKRHLVNMSRLKQAHPMIFSRRFVDREEFTKMLERLDQLDQGQRSTRLRLNGFANSLRELENRVIELEQVAKLKQYKETGL